MKQKSLNQKNYLKKSDHKREMEVKPGKDEVEIF